MHRLSISSWHCQSRGDCRAGLGYASRDLLQSSEADRCRQGRDGSCLQVPYPSRRAAGLRPLNALPKAAWPVPEAVAAGVAAEAAAAVTAAVADVAAAEVAVAVAAAAAAAAVALMAHAGCFDAKTGAYRSPALAGGCGSNHCECSRGRSGTAWGDRRGTPRPAVGSSCRASIASL